MSDPRDLAPEVHVQVIVREGQGIVAPVVIGPEADPGLIARIAARRVAEARVTIRKPGKR